MVFGVTLYFLLGTGLLAYALLPALREVVHGMAQRVRSHAQRAWSWRPARADRGPTTRLRWPQASLRMPWPRASVLAGGLALLVALPLIAALARHWWRLDTFDHTQARVADPHIAQLLQGKELVPPAPLPPELFTTSELAVARPLITQANRDWGLLDSEFRRRLLWVFRLMHERHGYELVLLEGWRSPERQNQLAAMGGHVTRATAFESQHQFGRAADVAFLREGRIVISEADPWAQRGYELYGALATSLGLTWGGQWTTLRDWGHVEWRGAGAPASAPTGRP